MTKGAANKSKQWDSCPLCGQANGCQVETPDDCWCKTAAIPSTVIDRANTANPQRDRCVCQQCITEHSESSTTDIDESR